MNATHISLAGCVLLLCSAAIPYVSAWLTARPSHLTGILTAALAGVGGVLSNLAANGWNDITWEALRNGLLAWLVAGGWHLLVSRDYEAATLHPTGPQLGKPKQV